MSDANILINLFPRILADPTAAKVYNPVFCYGSPIALSSASKWVDSVIAKEYPEAKIVRIDGPAFINRMIQIIWDSGDVTRFIKNCCNGDVLILTELEALAGKELSSEKLFYILDDYLLRDQVIIAFADTPPYGIPKLMPRILAQLEGGIILDLGKDPIEALYPLLHGR